MSLCIYCGDELWGVREASGLCTSCQRRDEYEAEQREQYESEMRERYEQEMREQYEADMATQRQRVGEEGDRGT